MERVKQLLFVRITELTTRISQAECDVESFQLARGY